MSASTPGSGNSRCTGVGVIYSNECSLCTRRRCAETLPLPLPLPLPMSVGSGRLMHARQTTVEYTIGYDLPVHSAVCTQHPRKPLLRSWFTAWHNTHILTVRDIRTRAIFSYYSVIRDILPRSIFSLSLSFSFISNNIFVFDIKMFFYMRKLICDFILLKCDLIARGQDVIGVM